MRLAWIPSAASAGSRSSSVGGVAGDHHGGRSVDGGHADPATPAGQRSAPLSAADACTATIRPARPARRWPGCAGHHPGGVVQGQGAGDVRGGDLALASARSPRPVGRPRRARAAARETITAHSAGWTTSTRSSDGASSPPRSASSRSQSAYGRSASAAGRQIASREHRRRPRAARPPCPATGSPGPGRRTRSGPARPAVPVTTSRRGRPSASAARPSRRPSAALGEDDRAVLEPGPGGGQRCTRCRRGRVSGRVPRSGRAAGRPARRSASAVRRTSSTGTARRRRGGPGVGLGCLVGTGWRRCLLEHQRGRWCR